MPDPALLHHRRDGGPLDGGAAGGGPHAGRVPLILGPSLGTSLRLWDEAVPALAADRVVIRYDLPGHGASPAEALPDLSAGATRVADLAQAVLRLADALGIDRFDYAGVSLGGAIGAWLAVHHPRRVRSLALICTSARFGDTAQWRERAKLVRDEGTGPVADAAPGRWFRAPFAASGAPIAAALLEDLRTADPAGYAACCDALAGFDLRGDLAAVAAPTLVVAGRDDVSTPVPHARELADGIPAASLLELAAAAHLAVAERPHAVARALRDHFADVECTDAEYDAEYTCAEPAGTAARAPAISRSDAAHAAGMSVRRAVLGDEHVDAVVARTTAFTADFQDFITRYAWGGIWTRPGLERRTRSAVTLTALVALGHHDELAMHVRGALRNGLSRDELAEILLQTAVYCGVPAANAAFAVAQRALAQLDGAEDQKPEH
ncbi:4-carboxymuconolactone decarboxylase [Actinocrinis puniceicyclus]|uniref:4-carboxymuconolactone decarboxylase n=1 Tax=Actinocrinis puniceicyclus TaxID=977794 RepID=A0A8J7WPJ5_9ACTN|nr:4-carboxymuconolactone decarboxylase [Actinocrinis puniceicyclus]MBS2963195.1 4-carboxymuconolactone decarboxylase [Actinocrinis puniceicyclus]